MRRGALVAVLLAVLAGAGTGIFFAVRGSTGFPPAEARQQFEAFQAQWRAQLSAGARADPGRKFPDPPHSWVKRRLADAEVLCGCFTVVEVKFLQPRQAAPVVVLEAKDEDAFFARETAIFNLVEPSWHHRRDWAYEGLLLEGVNQAGIPFLASDVFIRGTTYGGRGFWAAPRIERRVSHG